MDSAERDSYSAEGNRMSPNGEQIWEDVRRSIEDFLHNQWRNGALQGEKAETAYFVKCDPDTTAQHALCVLTDCLSCANGRRRQRRSPRGKGG